MYNLYLRLYCSSDPIFLLLRPSSFINFLLLHLRLVIVLFYVPLLRVSVFSQFTRKRNIVYELYMTNKVVILYETDFG